MPKTEASSSPATLAEQVAASDTGLLTSIKVDRIHVAPWNARKTASPAGMDELIASIREHGIQVPLLVRVTAYASTDSGFSYEIIAGHRRFRAAFKLNLPDVPCIVRDLSDDEAKEIGLIDNLQREDVPALEEADAYAELQTRLGTAAAIAQRVGKDVAYVTKRMQLRTLGEMPRKALAERLITIDHALLLARLGATEQDDNLKWALNVNAGVKEKVAETIAYRMKERDRSDRYGRWEPESVLSLKAHIEQSVGRKLKRAPWDLAATNLTADGVACVGCPSNTADNTALFGDLSIDEATCENGGCFETKRQTFVHIALTAAGEGAIKLSWKDSTAAPRWAKGTGPGKAAPAAVNPTQIFRHGQWVVAKAKSCEHVVWGVTVDWSDDNHHGFGPNSSKLRKPGERFTVCVAPKCKAHPKAWEKAAKEQAGPRNENSAAQREKRAKQAVLNRAENEIRTAAVQSALRGVKKLGGELLRALVQQAMARWSDVDPDDFCLGHEKTLAREPVESGAFARAAAVVLLCGDEQYFAHPDGFSNAEEGRAELVKLLRLFGYDASKHWQEMKTAKVVKAAKAPAKKAATKAAKKGGRK
jgi:ParB family chromosome partitioning protein